VEIDILHHLAETTATTEDVEIDTLLHQEEDDTILQRDVAAIEIVATHQNEGIAEIGIATLQSVEIVVKETSDAMIVVVIACLQIVEATIAEDDVIQNKTIVLTMLSRLVRLIADFQVMMEITLLTTTVLQMLAHPMLLLHKFNLRNVLNNKRDAVVVANHHQTMNLHSEVLEICRGSRGAT